MNTQPLNEIIQSNKNNLMQGSVENIKGKPPLKQDQNQLVILYQS